MRDGENPRSSIRTSVAFWAVILLTLLLASLSSAAQTSRSALVFEIDGAIGPATSDYIVRGLSKAADENATMAIIRMDTPGGLDTSMREIIQEILRSPVPVVTYVSPSGARAASAGAFILYASHVAAMTPGTNVGAATPVQIGAPSPLSPPEQEKEGQGKEGQQKDSAPQPKTSADAKAINDAVAYIRSLAELRGRNADWGEAAVRKAESLSANAALENKVIEIVARDMGDLVGQLNGRTVSVGGKERTLNTRNLALERIEPNWRTRLLAAITNPNVALILMMIGIYGLLFEFMNPGALYPGTIGAICLLTALYALAALPVNMAGLALISLGVALMVGEAFTPSFGILGIGGALAFVLGGAILVDTDLPQFQISWPVLIVVGIFGLVMAGIIARLAVTAHRRKVVSGREELIGSRGTVLDWEDGRGHVFVHSEQWLATGGAPLRAGESVRVTSLEGLTLQVEPDRSGEPVKSDPAQTPEG